MIAALLARQVRHDLLVHVDQAGAREGRRFLDPVLHDKYVFYAQKGSIKDFDADIKGKRVGVYAGRHAGSICTQKYYAGVLEPVGYENVDQIHADLVNGRIDLAFTEQLPGQDFMAKPKARPSRSARTIDDPAVLGKGAGAMFRKGDPLKAKVDEAIRAVYADGTVDKLQEEWMPGADISADKSW